MANRRKAIPVNVGGVVIGGAAPIAVQTMTKTDTREVKATLRQIHERKEADREQTADRMVEVALGHCKILEDLDYGPGFIKVSLKATDVWTNIMANRKFAAARPYPIHLGVTESGPVEAGSIRSAVGMGILLSEGTGDTIRVSLATSDPREEVRVAHEILKTLAFRNESPTLVACPTCGRLEYDMVPTVKAVEAYIAKLKIPITVAVMGCVVNGPAEARHADIGVTGGRGKGVIFQKGKLYGTARQDELLTLLLAVIL